MRSVFWRVLVVLIALQMPANMRSQSLTGTNLTSGCLPSFPYKDGWIGGDAGYSILLGSGKSLWLFGDSFVGGPAQRDRSGTRFIRNSIAISNCDQASGWQIKYYWRTKDHSIPTAFFDTKERKHWYWPLDGFLYRGRLYVAVSKLKNKPNEKVFSFETVAVYLARVTNLSAPPDQWQIKYLKLSEGSVYYPGSTIVLDDDFAYLFTVVEKAALKRQQMILCRLPLAALDKGTVSLQYFAKDKSWKPGLNGNDAAVVIETGHSEMSVRYHPNRKQWIAVSGGDFLSKQIMIRTAPALTGPWSAAQSIYEFPEMSEKSPGYDPDTWCYAVKEHIEFAQDDNLLITYACNSFKFEKLIANTNIYRPQAISVKLPK